MHKLMKSQNPLSDANKFIGQSYNIVLIIGLPLKYAWISVQLQVYDITIFESTCSGYYAYSNNLAFPRQILALPSFNRSQGLGGKGRLLLLLLLISRIIILFTCVDMFHDLGKCWLYFVAPLARREYLFDVHMGGVVLPALCTWIIVHPMNICMKHYSS